VPFGSERYLERNGQPVIVKKQVILTGENLTDAQPGLTADAGAHRQPDAGRQGRAHLQGRDAREHRQAHGHHAVRKGKGEVVTAPVIRSEIGGGRVQISGRMTTMEANDTALLLRAGSLAAPMEIIEEYTIGPSLGADNIAGIHSVVWGMLAIAFMCVYYMLFGVFSSIALAVNLLLLVAILSMLQATLTLPGIAAMALALGMAIDSNVLINERIREELRGVSPQAAIHAGYERAWPPSGLQRHHADRRSGAAGFRLGPGARLCRGALHRHPDQHVLGRVLLARSGQPLVRRQEEAQEPVHRPGLEAEATAPPPSSRNKGGRPWSSGSSITCATRI
jgi:preprotein translocase subunit SecD